jgi:GT2 family glycosyltransferase
MKLSVIIVNYNVRAYLEQCLRTVFTALDGIAGEVFVVDNLSTDGSLEMVRDKFPQVHLIANRENVGFSRANNQAIRLAKGEYVLLLNPDTIVGEDVFHKVLAFLDAHPRAGGLGVKMIDGTGRFLPESKRGLPTPQVAFFKIIGLTRLFPKSRLFGRYHLGHLPENETARIEILSGACMFLRKTVLEKVGLLDESFFMYGEDIDLSYRITLGGYENWYLPEARIVHYKGESTKKSSVNYVFVFYNAMAIFAKKHFTNRSSGIFTLLINGSIYLSAAGAIAIRFLNRALLPVLDLMAILLLFTLWQVMPDRWPVMQELGTDLVVGAVGIGLLALLGAYDRPLRFLPPVIAVGITASVVGLAQWYITGHLNALVNVLLLAGSILGALLLVRFVLHTLRVRGYGMRKKERERILAIGSQTEAKEALSLLWQTHFGLGWTGTAVVGTPDANAEAIARTVRRQRVGEVVLCARDLSWKRIIELLETLKGSRAEFKIAQPGNEFIIGPSSIESVQDLYILEEHSLGSPAAKRTKRILDVTVATLLLLGMPLCAWLIDDPRQAARNAWQVLRGKRSWVGYRMPLPSSPRLPQLRPGVLDPVPTEAADDVVMARANIMYAKDYRMATDLGLVARGFRMLGRR